MTQRGNVFWEGSLDVPVCVWRHLCASPAVKSVKIFDKTVVFYLFEALAYDKKNLKWIFFSYGNYETCYMFYIPCSGT